MSEDDRMKGKLEALEVVYGAVTDRDLIESRPDENNRGVYVFDDGYETHSLTAAVGYGVTLHGFAVNQLKQSTV